jgi:hypothetical protein
MDHRGKLRFTSISQRYVIESPDIHISIQAIIRIAALAISQHDSEDKATMLHHPVAAIPIGALLGKLPDIIEPSLANPNHRQFFHSVAVLGLLGAGMHKLYR